jgi:hypothetical protein
MGTVDLAELIGIWEYWTQGDPLLRQAEREYAGANNRHQEVVDRILDRLVALANLDHADAATVAALSAGWAVLLALEHPHFSDNPHWQVLHRDALRDHREALAGRLHRTEDTPAINEA